MENNRKLVLIDNGHGEETPGKRSPDGAFREYDYARRVTSQVVGDLKNRGMNAVTLVPEKIDVPLAERVRRANAYCSEYGRENVVLASVHCNASGDGSRWMPAQGWAAYTSRGQTEADRLADCLYRAAERLFGDRQIRKDLSDGDADFEAGFYILCRTLCAAVLTENFFQDNIEDVAYLCSDEGFQAIVNVHVEGLLDYLQY